MSSGTAILQESRTVQPALDLQYLRVKHLNVNVNTADKTSNLRRRQTAQVRSLAAGISGWFWHNLTPFSYDVKAEFRLNLHISVEAHSTTR